MGDTKIVDDPLGEVLRLARLVRFTLDLAAFSDRLDRFGGFLALGAAWIVATGLAVQFILRGEAIRHRRWMMRS